MYTDPKRTRADIPGNVEGNPVFTYHDLFNPNKEEVEDLKKRYREGKVGDVEVKDKLTNALNNYLDPIRKKRESLSDKEVERIIKEGALKAKEVAGKTLGEVKEYYAREDVLAFLNYACKKRKVIFSFEDEPSLGSERNTPPLAPRDTEQLHVILS